LAVAITAKEHAELAEGPPLPELGPEEVRPNDVHPHQSRHRTGRELSKGSTFPNYPGYAAVFEVQEAGEKVTRFRSGDIAFAMGGRRSVQQVSPMSSASTTRPRPPERSSGCTGLTARP
jgi:NADPH:quinone reductase-like Zn-dependent oxidoreductase